MVAVGIHRNGGIHCLKQVVLIDAGDEEAGLVKGFRALGAGADADSRERMTDAGEETGFLGEGAAVANHGESVHL